MPLSLSASMVWILLVRFLSRFFSDCSALVLISSFVSKNWHLTKDYPLCKAGKDALVKAKTGTGKSMAFLVFYNPLPQYHWP